MIGKTWVFGSYEDWNSIFFKKKSTWSKWWLNLVAILIIFSNKMHWVLILVVTRWIYVPIPFTTKIKSTNTILMYLNVVTKFFFVGGFYFLGPKFQSPYGSRPWSTRVDLGGPWLDLVFPSIHWTQFHPKNPLNNVDGLPIWVIDCTNF